jgi:TPR repeat protein
MYHLGIMAEKGLAGPPDNAAARRWYHKAAKNGFSKACLPLSDFCFYGTGGSVDYPMALLWAEKGALLPDAYLMYRAGYMYEKGLGCSQNLIHARTWYQKASNLGNANAGKRLKIVSRLLKDTI